MIKRRVVVTGLGIVAPNGIGKEAFWQANVNGISGVSVLRHFDTSALSTRIAASIYDFDPACSEDPKRIGCIRSGIIPPTINYRKKDPESDLDYVPNHARAARVENVLSNSFGFDSCNACLALKRHG
jgi:3-oxoacyl-(acyl-carrier-protein) synthase